MYQITTDLTQMKLSQLRNRKLKIIKYKSIIWREKLMSQKLRERNLEDSLETWLMQLVMKKSRFNLISLMPNMIKRNIKARTSKNYRMKLNIIEKYSKRGRWMEERAWTPKWPKILESNMMKSKNRCSK